MPDFRTKTVSITLKDNGMTSKMTQETHILLKKGKNDATSEMGVFTELEI